MLLFAGILVASTGILLVVSVLLFQLGAEHRAEMIRDVEIHAVGMRQEAIVRIVTESASDLLFLSELNEIGPFLASQSPETRNPLARELLAFAHGERVTDRITILSPSGMELLRVDDREGVPALAAEEDLRFLGDGEFFRGMSGHSDGAIYVSRLGVESAGETAGPGLRLGLALPSEGGEIRGYLLVSLRGDAVIDAFTSAHPDEGATELLASGEGEWLRGPPSDAQSSTAPSGQRAGRFQDRFPSAWPTIAASESGQFEAAQGLFTYGTLIPSAEIEAIRSELTGSPSPPVSFDTASSWKNVSWVPAAIMAATRNAGVVHLAGWDAVGFLVLGGGTLAFTRWVKRRSDQHRTTAREKELLHSTLQKHMAPEVCQRLLGDPARHGRLGGESQDVAVLFADIRGFTRFVEHHDPKDVVAILNRTMSELITPLRVYGGILDKYVGDGFLAFFEPSPDLASAAKSAVDAAQAMQRVFNNLWKDASSEELRGLGLGIGIGTGRVVVGNVGSEEAMDYTVIGDAVNVAARLQGMAEAGEILVSQPTYSMLSGEKDAVVVRMAKLRGREAPMDVIRLRADEPTG